MITIDPASSTAPFEQLRTQLAEQIRSGELVAGTRLPTVRRMADDLGIAPNTVARAYRELEQEGLVETRGRNGTVVAWSPDDGERQLQQAAAGFAARVRALGVDPGVARRMIEQALTGPAT